MKNLILYIALLLSAFACAPADPKATGSNGNNPGDGNAQIQKEGQLLFYDTAWCDFQAPNQPAPTKFYAYRFNANLSGQRLEIDPHTNAVLNEADFHWKELGSQITLWWWNDNSNKPFLNSAKGYRKYQDQIQMVLRDSAGKDSYKSPCDINDLFE